MTVLSIDHRQNIVVLGTEEDAQMAELELVDFIGSHPYPHFLRQKRSPFAGKTLPVTVQLETIS